LLNQEGVTAMTARNGQIAGSMIILTSTLVFGLLLATLSRSYRPAIFCSAGAILYSVLKYRGSRDMVFTVFIVTLLHLLVFEVTEPRYFLEFFLYYAALGASVLIYYRTAVPRLAGIRIGKFIALALLILVLYSVVTVIVSLLSSGRSLSQSLTGILTVYSLAGAALGLGIETGELLTDRLFPRPLER
jgi:hypothetical protein